jgi:hypothetical protein
MCNSAREETYAISLQCPASARGEKYWRLDHGPSRMARDSYCSAHTNCRPAIRSHNEPVYCGRARELAQGVAGNPTADQRVLHSNFSGTAVARGALQNAPDDTLPTAAWRDDSARNIGGTGPDFSPVVTGHITDAEGSFDSVTGVTATPDYSLQLNTDFFPTSTCNGSPNATCRGWEQFVYESAGTGFIQYWLVHYGPPGTQCPMPRHTSCAPNSVYSDGCAPSPSVAKLIARSTQQTVCPRRPSRRPPSSK